MSSLLKALAPTVPVSRYGTVTESMLDGTYRVNIDGKIRRITSAVATPPLIGSQVIVTLVSGRETITSIGLNHGSTIMEVTING